MKRDKKKNGWQAQNVNELPRHLRGLSQNTYGGHNSTPLTGFRGATYGAAGECRTYSAEQRAEWARRNGYL